MSYENFPRYHGTDDSERFEFLRALDAAAHTVEVTDWEAEFLAQVLTGKFEHLSPKQRAVADRMMQDYAEAIGFE